MTPVTQETLPDGTIIIWVFDGEKWHKVEALND
jgi:hypothetical protein